MEKRKFLMSVAWRALAKMKVEEILEYVKAIDKTQSILGIEIGTEDYDQMEKALVFSIQRGWIFQCHTPKLNTKEDIYRYLDTVGRLAEKYGKNINIVLHSFEMDSIENSMVETVDFVDKVLKYIEQNNLNLTIALENLNYHNGHKRINMDKIDEILAKYPSLKFTYDIGHDIYDNSNITKLTNLQKSKIADVHIHDVINEVDHCEIKETSTNLETLRNSIKMLNNINYTGPIVLESGIDYYEGESYEEKLIKYIKSFSKISDMLN